MADDEKHARELIAEADGWVNADLVARHAMSALDTIRRLRNALEGALPGDDDFEYRYAEVYEHDTYTYGPDDGGWFATVEAARAASVEDSDVIVRRRKPGPVEILPEPVEEVPVADGFTFDLGNGISLQARRVPGACEAVARHARARPPIHRSRRVHQRR